MGEGVTEAELREAVEWITDRAPHWDDRNMLAVQRLNLAIAELVRLRQGVYGPPANPRPLRDFLGVLPPVEQPTPMYELWDTENDEPISSTWWANRADAERERETMDYPEVVEVRPVADLG